MAQMSLGLSGATNVPLFQAFGYSLVSLIDSLLLIGA